MKIWAFVKSVFPQVLHLPISPSVLFQKSHKIQLKITVKRAVEIAIFKL